MKTDNEDTTINPPTVEWLEYVVMSALHDLKEVAPGHYLVTTVEMALQARAFTGEKAPALARRQAE